MKPLLVALLLSPALFAGSAAFLPDGKRVARQGDSGVLILDLAKATESELKFPEDFQVEYVGLSATADALLLAGGQRVMSWNPATDAWTELWSAPVEVTVDDVACDPKSGRVLVTTSKENGEPQWWVLDPKQPGKVGKVFNRRAAYARNPVFDPSGNLYFAVHGDLWKGAIDTNDSEELPFVLSGTRIWPLAAQETSDANSGGVSAHEILPLEKHLLVELSRTGGSGWGNVIRVPNADAYEKHLPLKWDELEDCSSGSSMALSRDGKQAAIYIRSAKRWYQVDVKAGSLTPLPNSAPAKGK
ncbi:hypothetical protein [Luteolibacter soli]|uniref:SMP-30/Gluconolactonase/LRE-like region domain-containing protein n=1 Tax=Luteolibacter soli TaxID=3135280 RepID=A0ABU9B166_9BACT